MMWYRFLFLLAFSSILAAGVGQAQDYELSPREDYYQSQQQPHVFSSDRWREATEGIDYSETVRAERQEDENFFTDGEAQQRRKERENANNTSAVWSSIFKFLIIALGIFIIAVIIARFLGPEGLGKPRSKRFTNEQLKIELENIEQNIHESDLDQYIRQALDRKDYNLAIRLYYLAIIKELSLSKSIRWKRDKTNRDYLRELSGQDILPEFRSLTVIFERLWYGDHQLQEADFDLLRPRFEQMIEKAKKGVVDLAK